MRKRGQEKLGVWGGNVFKGERAGRKGAGESWGEGKKREWK